MNAADLEKIAAKFPLSSSTRALNAARPPARPNDAPATLTPPKRATGKQASFLNYDNHPRTQVSDPKPTQQARALEPDHEGEASRSGRPHVCFTLYRVRLLDVDAKWGSLKDLLDFLATCGAIPGDREDQISLDCKQVQVAHFAEEKTVIEVEVLP